MDELGTEELVLSKLNYEKLLSAFCQLDEIYQSPLKLRVQGYKISEIAELLDIEPGNVKVRLPRARNILLRELEETNGQD